MSPRTSHSRRRALPALLAGILIALAGCATPAKDSPKSNSHSPEMSREEQQWAILELRDAVALQTQEIAKLKDALAAQKAKYSGELTEVQRSLKLHLDLLSLYYKQLANLGVEIPELPAEPPASASSVSGRAKISRSNASPMIFEKLEVRLLAEGVHTDWESLQKPRTLYNIPIRNPETVFSALDVQYDPTSGKSVPQAPSPIAAFGAILSAYLQAFDSSIKPEQVIATTKTDEQGQFRLGPFAPGTYYLYARVSHESYSIAWLVPLAADGRTQYEVNLSQENAQIFLNDL